MIQKTPCNYSKRRRKAAESRHSPLRLLLTRKNISLAKPSGLGNSPAFFLLKFTCTDAGRSQQTETKTKPAVKRHFLPFLKSSKGLFWPFFANLFNEMERGWSYTYITKILLVKPLTPKKYFEKQSAWKLAYIYVIYYEVSSLNVSGLRYWRSRICF